MDTADCASFSGYGDAGRESLRGAKGDNDGGGDSSASREDFAPRRNEANGRGNGVARIEKDEVTPRRNEANGHGGETELAGETQAEVIERRRVGSATVTRFSLAAGVKGNRAASRRERERAQPS